MTWRGLPADRLSRRQILLALGGLMFPAPLWAVSVAEGAGDILEHYPRVATLTPWIIETLVAIGIEPLAVPELHRKKAGGEIAAFRHPPVDLGLVGEPNLELLDRLDLDFIFIDAGLQGSGWQRLMSPIAPVVMGEVYSERQMPLDAARSETLRFGNILARRQNAERVVADVDHSLQFVKQSLIGRSTRPVFVVRMLDDRNIILYCGGSIFHDVLVILGIPPASPVSNNWGFLITGIETLASVPDARIVWFEPAPKEARRLFEQPSLWSHLPSVQKGLTTQVPEFYSWAALPTAKRFAEALAERFSQEDAG